MCADGGRAEARPSGLEHFFHHEIVRKIHTKARVGLLGVVVFAFDVKERERIHTALGDFDAFKIVPDVWYVSDGKLKSQAHGTVLWVSADKRHLPLLIQSEAFIGSVRAELIKVDGIGPPGSS